MIEESSEQAVTRQEPQKIWNKMFISLFFTNLALNMGMFMSSSLLSVYINSLGAQASTIGMVMGAFTISSISLRLVSAPVMDTYNRKYIVGFASVLLATAFFGFSMSKNIPGLVLFRVVQGAGMAFGNACCLAMVSETLPRDKYSRGLGYYSLAQTMCQATGPLVGLTLAGWVGYSMTFAITAVVMLVSALLAFQIKNEFKQTKKLKLTFNNIFAKEALLPASIIFVLVIGGSAVNSFVVIFAGNQGVTSNIGLYFTTTAAMMLITRPLVGKLTDRFGIVKILIPALLCNVLSFFIISGSSTLISFLLAALISAFGQGACHPAMLALSMKSVPNDRRGAASSTNYIGQDLGVMAGPVIAGNIAQAFGYVTMWHVMTIPFVLGMVLVFVCRHRISRIEKNFNAG